MSATAARTRTTIPVCSMANGHALELDVHELVGRSPGPVVGITAGIHGDEPIGVETARRVLEGIDPDQLSGTVLGLPVCNPYALAALTRNTPIDMNNLNRVFPGDPDGMLTEQLAHAIVTRFLPRCEYLFDLHSGGNLPCVDYVYLHEPGGDIGRIFGAELMLKSDTYVGSLGYEATQRGIPVVVTEYGGGQARSEHYVEKGVRGILNALRHLNMLEGDPEPLPAQRVVTQMQTVRPHQGGLLLSEVRPDQLGESVPQGSLLGTIRHPSTFAVLERLEAPFDPSILVLVRDSVTRVEPGDYAFMVANGASVVPE